MGPGHFYRRFVFVLRAPSAARVRARMSLVSNEALVEQASVVLEASIVEDTRLYAGEQLAVFIEGQHLANGEKPNTHRLQIP